jgi:putative FmdB family regulatory protein
MPIYEYVCKSGHRTELILSIKEELPESTRCRKCKKKAPLVPSMTCAPILKAGGVGGFYKPTRPERHSED